MASELNRQLSLLRAYQDEGMGPSGRFADFIGKANRFTPTAQDALSDALLFALIGAPDLEDAIPGMGTLRGGFKPGQFRIERLPNGLTRLDDRDSGLTKMFKPDGAPHSGPTLFKHLSEVPHDPPSRPQPPQFYSAHAGGRSVGRSEHHGFYSSQADARKSVEDLKRMGIPTSVRRRKPKREKRSGR